MNGFKYIRSEIMNKSMEELALMLNVSKQTVYTWECGKKKIPQNRLQQLSEISGIPCNFFLSHEISEKAKITIKKYYLDKALDDAVDEYENSVKDDDGQKTNYTQSADTELVKHIDATEMDLKIDSALKKVKMGIHADTRHDSNEQKQVLCQMLRAMELLVDENVKDKRLRGEDVLSNETSLVQDLYFVLCEHRSRVEDEGEVVK